MNNVNKLSKKEKKINKKLNRVTKRLGKIKIRAKRKRVDKRRVISDTAIGFRNLGTDKALHHLQMYRKYKRNEYLAGLLFPDQAVRQGIPVKLPSDLPLPTAAIGFHESYQFSTNANGCFLLSWKPNYLVSGPLLTSNSYTGYSHLTYNNSSALTGTAGVAGNIFVSGSYAPNVDLQRYRLVSALIKVSYNGSVLNQSGTLLSCITFDVTQVAISNSANPMSSFSDVYVDRFGNFSLIANGLWNTTTNITNNGEGIEALYIPMDPMDAVFDKIGTYYGNGPGVGTFAPFSDSAPQTYIFAGRNLPASSSCIYVDIYYNYEVIADPSAAPILRSSTNDVPSKADMRLVSDSLSNNDNSKMFIRKVSSHNESMWSKILHLGVKYLPSLVSHLAA